jgi:murein DD-endopeptidase MepM/ murein hydrolase activator NlpD
LHIDFNPPIRGSAKRLKRTSRLRFWLLLALGTLLVFSFFFRSNVNENDVSIVEVSQPTPPKPPEIKREIIRGEIASGDTITGLLGTYFDAKQIHALNQVSKPVFPLSGLCAGQPYRLCLTNGEFERFEYDIDKNEQLIISRDSETFQVERQPIPYTVAIERVRGKIDSSLFEAVTQIGESEVLAMNLADIFAWDIDFILDIRQGDSFQALVEKRFREGQPAGYGRILAAEFTNQGTTFEAILYQDGDKRPDYYDADGKSLRKAFLKAPLAFSRISSGFTMRRFHPITKTWKAHPAIDYAAPRGTPIKSVGDGIVIKKGYTRGNGNFIKIRHNSSYETLYLHMSKFARGVKQGHRVSQGQTIGYVGSTGLATGPHLCFRMYKNGSPVNPHRVRTPSAAPIVKQNMQSFQVHRSTVLGELYEQPIKITKQDNVAQQQSSQN